VAVQKLPQDPEAHFALGSLLLHEKKFPESQQELLIAVRLKPDLAEAYSNLAVVASSNKNYAWPAGLGHAGEIPAGNPGYLFPARRHL
jgi:uncharacterized protein HemY